MRLGKYHGLGNDFLVALCAHDPAARVEPDQARRFCDRRRGIGADGLIYALEPADATNDARMVLLNADGSRAEISGNGIRCLAQALLREAAERGAPSAPGTVTRIETDGGLREVRLSGGDPRRCAVFTVDMGVPSEGPPLSEFSLRRATRHVATVDIGNPHLVVEVDDPRAVDLETEGPALESAYPEGINVHFVTAPDPGHLVMAVWERGVGITEACGSGGAAAVAVANDWGLVDADHGPVDVEMPGGTATVELREGRLFLSGPSEFVGEVQTP